MNFINKILANTKQLLGLDFAEQAKKVKSTKVLGLSNDFFMRSYRSRLFVLFECGAFFDVLLNKPFFKPMVHLNNFKIALKFYVNC